MTNPRHTKYDLDRALRRLPERRAELVEACRGQHVTPDAVWLVWRALVDRALTSTYCVDSTQVQIATEAPTSTHTVRRALWVLRSLGWLAQVTKPQSPGSRGGAGRAAVYRLAILDNSAVIAAIAPHGTPNGKRTAPHDTPNNVMGAPQGSATAPHGTPLYRNSDTDYSGPRHDASTNDQRRQAIVRAAWERTTDQYPRPRLQDVGSRLDNLCQGTTWSDWYACGNADDLTTALASKVRGEAVSQTIAERLDHAVRHARGQSPDAQSDTSQLDDLGDLDPADITSPLALRALANRTRAGEAHLPHHTHPPKGHQ